jgi:hypothetical protein
MKTMEIQTMLGLIVSGILAIATPSELLAQSETQLLIDGAMKECHQGRVLQDRAARIAHFEK